MSYTVFSAGFGLVNAPITNTAVSGMPREQAGVAAAVASTSRQVGATLGVAVIGSVLAARLTGPLSDGFRPGQPRRLVDHRRGGAARARARGARPPGRRAVASARAPRTCWTTHPSPAMAV